MKSLLWILMVMSLSGCTLFAQRVVLKPEVILNKENIGNNAKVFLTVKDRRGNKEIGYRSIMQTGKMTIADDINKIFYEQMRNILEAKGFAVVSEPQDEVTATCELAIHIFRYAVTPSFDLAIQRKIAVNIDVNGVYSKVFQLEEEGHELMAPTAAHNQDLINQTLSKLFNQIAADRKIYQTLTQQLN